MGVDCVICTKPTEAIFPNETSAADGRVKCALQTLIKLIKLELPSLKEDVDGIEDSPIVLSCPSCSEVLLGLMTLYDLFQRTKVSIDQKLDWVKNKVTLSKKREELHKLRSTSVEENQQTSIKIRNILLEFSGGLESKNEQKNSELEGFDIKLEPIVEFDVDDSWDADENNEDIFEHGDTGFEQQEQEHPITPKFEENVDTEWIEETPHNSYPDLLKAEDGTETIYEVTIKKAQEEFDNEFLEHTVQIRKTISNSQNLKDRRHKRKTKNISKKENELLKKFGLDDTTTTQPALCLEDFVKLIPSVALDFFVPMSSCQFSVNETKISPHHREDWNNSKTIKPALLASENERHTIRTRKTLRNRSRIRYPSTAKKSIDEEELLQSKKLFENPENSYDDASGSDYIDDGEKSDSDESYYEPSPKRSRPTAANFKIAKNAMRNDTGEKIMIIEGKKFFQGNQIRQEGDEMFCYVADCDFKVSNEVGEDEVWFCRRLLNHIYGVHSETIKKVKNSQGDLPPKASIVIMDGKKFFQENEIRQEQDKMFCCVPDCNFNVCKETIDEAETEFCRRLLFHVYAIHPDFINEKYNPEFLPENSSTSKNANPANPNVKKRTRNTTILYNCNYCNLFTPTLNKLRFSKHMRSAHRSIKDPRDPRVITKKSTNVKKRTRNTTILYNCNHCTLFTQTLNKLRFLKHMRSAHRSIKDPLEPRENIVINPSRIIPKECEICGKPFNTLQFLNRHRWTHCNEEEIAAKLSSGEPDPRLASYLKPNRPNQPKPSLMCEECGKILKSKFQLEAHINSHKDESERQKWICEFEGCGKILYSFATHRLHVKKIHHPDTIRWNHCKHCERKFIIPAHLRRHVERHHGGGGDKKFKCQQCSWAFVDKRGLDKHTITHLGKDYRPHKCSFCPEAYRHDSNLRRHLKAAHDTAPEPKRPPQIYKPVLTCKRKFPCEVCDRIFDKPFLLRKHLELNQCHPGSSRGRRNNSEGRGISKKSQEYKSEDEDGNENEDACDNLILGY